MKPFMALAAVATLAAAGCGLAAMRPVRVDATPALWESLSGEWRGDYTLSGSSRHGLITFRLQAAGRQAFGDVLMIPDRLDSQYGPQRDVPGQPAGRDESQLLAIRFVAAEGAGLHGSMDPYWDPDRRCQARASFLGSIDGDAIAGSLVTVCEGGDRKLQGHWKVERQARR